MTSTSANNNSSIQDQIRLATQATQDQTMVLLEELAKANRRANDENRALCEEMMRCDEENKKYLKTMEEKLDLLSSSSQSPSPNRTPSRRRANRVVIPRQCRVSS